MDKTPKLPTKVIQLDLVPVRMPLHCVAMKRFEVWICIEQLGDSRQKPPNIKFSFELWTRSKIK